MSSETNKKRMDIIFSQLYGCEWKQTINCKKSNKMNKIPDKIKKDMACDRIGRKLIKYLEENKAKGNIDFALRIDSDTHFYIHPQDKDGETLDISWDWTKATYGNEVFGYTNKWNEFDDPTDEPKYDPEKQVGHSDGEYKEDYSDFESQPTDEPDAGYREEYDQAVDKINYWKKRCEAAEKLMLSFTSNGFMSWDCDVKEQWQQLKQTPAKDEEQG